MKPDRKKIIIWSVGGLFLALLSVAIVSVVEYRRFSLAAKAAGALPWQDGGRITYVQMGCTRSCLGKCCCAMCDASCEGSTQINFTGQKGTMFMCVPAGLVYKGGGTMPAIGMNVIAGGISNVMPLIVAIPSAVGSRVQYLVDSFTHLFAWL